MTAGLQTSDRTSAARTPATAPPTAADAKPPAPPEAPAAPRRGFFGSVGRAILASATWLPVLAALVGASVFLVLFALTTSGRLWAPFNLEWMENHTARQALRFANNLPLYPADASEWVPYMYTPLYHMTLGALFKITGDYSLGLGRVISLVSTFGLALGLISIVRSHTRQWFPALLAGLLYFAYFKPSGSWFDLVRSDSMALCLCAWGMFFTLRRNPSAFAIGLGALLLAMATLTKQSVGPAAVLAALWPLIAHPRRARIVVLPLGLLLLNAIMLFEASGNEKFQDYTIFQPLNHGDNTTIWWPAYKDTKTFQDSLKNPTDKLATAKEYWRRNQDAPSWVWKDFGANVWLFAILIALWPLCALRRLKIPYGATLAIPTLALIWGGLTGLAKTGGFNNNLMPCFIGVSLLTGLAAGELRNAFPKRAWFLPNTIISLAVLAQLYQPWRLPPNQQLQPAAKADLARIQKRLEASAAASTPSPETQPEAIARRSAEIAGRRIADANSAMYVARAATLGKITDPTLRQQLQDYFNELDAAARERRAVSAPARANLRDPKFLQALGRHQLDRISGSGLLWLPSQQTPSSDSKIAYDWIMDWLRMKAAAKEPVWLAHNQWMGSLTGHPTGLDVDMIRAAQYAGVGAPPSLLGPLRDQSYDWIILDAAQLQYEYVTGEEMRDLILKNYDAMGPLPIYSRVAPNALFPMTGAPTRPYMLYRAKRCSKPVGDPSQPGAADAEAPQDPRPAGESAEPATGADVTTPTAPTEAAVEPNSPESTDAAGPEPAADAAPESDDATAGPEASGSNP